MSVSAVIPLRYRDCCDQQGQPIFLLAGKTLWHITIGQALDCGHLQDVIVAYDDDRFLPHLEEWGDRIRLCKRPAALSESSKTNIDVLAFVASQDAAFSGVVSDYLILLEITHPLRPKGIISQVAHAAEELGANSLITCRRSHYNLWRRTNGQEMTRVISSGDASNVETYQELLGICSVFSSDCLGTENPFGDVVDIVPIDKFWATIDLRDADGLWLAEKYLERAAITL